MGDAPRPDRPGDAAGAGAPARQSAPRRPAPAAPPRADGDAGQAPLPPGHDGPRESTRHRDTRIGGAVVAAASAGVAWGAWRAGPRTPDRSRRSRWRGGGRFEPRSISRVERGASPPRAGPPGARAQRRESRRTLRRSRQHRVRHLSGLSGRGRPRPHPAHQRPRAVHDREVGFGQGRAVGADREGPLALGGDRLETAGDSVGGAPPADVDLVRPTLYTLLAPVSNVLDALTFLSLERAIAFLVTWVAALALWGLLRRGTLWRRLAAAVLAPLAVILLGVAAVLLPRPVPRLVAADSTLTVIDYHAHTALSHDGRRGWTVQELAAWHAAQGFGASYVTDHNVVFNGGVDDPIRLLPGVECSGYDQHVVALGAVPPLERGVNGR